MAVNAALGPPVVPAELVQHDVLAQGAVGIDGVGAQFPHPVGRGVGLDDVQAAFVGRHQQPVGAGGIEGHPLAGIAAVGLGISPQDVPVHVLLLLAGVDVALVPGIAEPDAPPPVYGQVVRGVQALAVQPVNDGAGAAVRLEADDGTAAGTATVEAAIGVEGQPVGVVGVLAVDAALAGLRVCRP